MLDRGVWVSEGQTVNADGTLVGERPKTKRVGFHLSSLYSPWRTWCEMVGEFIRAEGDIAATMTFRNSRLGEPFEIQVGKIEAGTVRAKAAKGPPPRIVPPWARIVVSTVDTQRDHFYYVVRAWGYGYRSQRIEAGICASFAALRKLALDRTFAIGRPSPSATVTAANAADGDGGSAEGRAPISLQLIDSGGGRNSDTGDTRTNEVYEYALSDPERIKPIKGASFATQWPVDKKLQKANGLVLWLIDTSYCKHLLTRLMNDEDATRWMVDRAAGEDYFSQMASEHLVINPRTKKQEWKPKSSGAPNHYWDCEVYQVAAAVDCQLDGDEPADQSQTPKGDDEEKSTWELRPWEK
jgi:phage terminase large subunit GpA-like protein